jgi:hypothetical protein
MDLFTGLLLIQKDIQDTVLKQYQQGVLLDGCAVALGARPPHMASLYTGVLGRPVYSALREESQSGGQSAEDQRRMSEMLLKMLNKGGKWAEQSQVLFDPNLSKGERTEKFVTSVVNDFGGPIPFTIQALTAGGALLGGGREIYTQYKKAKESELETALEEAFNDNELQELLKASNSNIDKVTALIDSYKELNKNIKDLKDLHPDDEVDPKKFKNGLTALAKQIDTRKPADEQEPLVQWLASSIGSIVELVAKENGETVQLKKLSGDAQGVIGNAIRRISLILKEPKDEADQASLASSPEPSEANVLNVKAQLNADVELYSKNLLIAFRNESLILRFMLQQILKAK